VSLSSAFMPSSGEVYANYAKLQVIVAVSLLYASTHGGTTA
jgi:hypothetical protein